MKIVFICGSIEPGMDGVGDYTKILAGTLIALGYEVSIISLYDTYVSKIKLETQENSIKTHRIPFHLDEAIRFKELNTIINNFNPDWISFQFVIFSFHPKGLPWMLGIKLKRVIGNRNVHIMFHELWVAMDQESSFKLKILGKLQKLIINNILKQIKPKVIHTHTPLYQWQLSKIGFDSHILPLFGNIPVKDIYKKQQKGYRFLVFGSIHFGAPIEVFAEELLSLELQNNKISEVIFVGRCGSEQIYWEKVLQEKGISHTSLGEQSVENISEILMGSDYGITSTPYLLTEKSGTVAAMLEHGLPVICVARNWHVDSYYQTNTSLSAIVEYKSGHLFSILEQKPIEKRSLQHITNQFIHSLK